MPGLLLSTCMLVSCNETLMIDWCKPMWVNACDIFYVLFCHFHDKAADSWVHASTKWYDHDREIQRSHNFCFHPFTLFYAILLRIYMEDICLSCKVWKQIGHVSNAIQQPPLDQIKKSSRLTNKGQGWQTKVKVGKQMSRLLKKGQGRYFYNLVLWLIASL